MVPWQATDELTPQSLAVTPVPDTAAVRSLQPGPGRHEFIVLASDGVWDVAMPQDVVDFVRERLPGAGEEKQQGAPRKGGEAGAGVSGGEGVGGGLRGVAEAVVARCMAAGSRDNITFMLVRFTQQG